MNTLRSTAIVMFLLAIASCLASAQAAKEPAKTVAGILNRSLSNVESEFVPAVEAMPEDKFGFAPSQGAFKGVRTFAQQAKHVSAVNYMIGAALLQEKPPVDLGGESGPDNIKTKAEIMQFMKDSFAYLHKALDTVTEKSAVEEIKSPFSDQKMSRLGAATIALTHPFDHYGQMVEYLRMNDIIPPASR